MVEDIINGHSLIRVLLEHAFKQVLEVVADVQPLLVRKLKFRFEDLIGEVPDVFLREFVLGYWEWKLA